MHACLQPPVKVLLLACACVVWACGDKQPSAAEVVANDARQAGEVVASELEEQSKHTLAQADKMRVANEAAAAEARRNDALIQAWDLARNQGKPFTANACARLPEKFERNGADPNDQVTLEMATKWCQTGSVQGRKCILRVLNGLKPELRPWRDHLLLACALDYPDPAAVGDYCREHRKTPCLQLSATRPGESGQ